MASILVHYESGSVLPIHPEALEVHRQCINRFISTSGIRLKEEKGTFEYQYCHRTRTFRFCRWTGR